MKKLYTLFLSLSFLAFSHIATGQNSDKATLSSSKKLSVDPIKKTEINAEKPTLSETSKITIAAESTKKSKGTTKLAEKQALIEPPKP